VCTLARAHTCLNVSLLFTLIHIINKAPDSHIWSLYCWICEWVDDRARAQVTRLKSAWWLTGVTHISRIIFPHLKNTANIILTHTSKPGNIWNNHPVARQ